jgi:hypothetical protein
MSASNADLPFSLVLAEAETGIVLTSEGARHVSGQMTFTPAFARWEDAIREKDNLLQRFPFAEVVIRDATGERQPRRFVDELAFSQYLVRMTAWRRWHDASWVRRLFTRQPTNPREAK